MERHLAAILYFDVVGYSLAMGRDEASTLEALKANQRAVIGPQAEQHGGRTIKLMGDGALMEFASAVDGLEDHLGPRDGELVALAAHGLDQDREVQLAAPRDLELVRILTRLDPERDVVNQLLGQAVAQVAAGDILAVAPATRCRPRREP